MLYCLRAFCCAVIWVGRGRVHYKNEPSYVLKIDCFSLLHKSGWKERELRSAYTLPCAVTHTLPFPKFWGQWICIMQSSLLQNVLQFHLSWVKTQAPSWGCQSSLKMHFESCRAETENTYTATCSRHHFRDMKSSLYCL